MFRLSLDQRQRAWDRWVSGELGHRVQIEERRLARRELRRLFGQVVVQVGGSAGFPLIADAMAPHRLHIVFGGELPTHSHCPLILAEDHLLPIPSESVDILILQHCLDLSAHPHQVLREVERVLRPGGRLLVLGFNPHSLWGLRRLLGTRFGGVIPWQTRFMKSAQVEDWCRLLNLVPEHKHHAVYSLPVVKRSIRKLLKRFEHGIARRDWPVGAVYCIRAKKERVAFIQSKPSPLSRLTQGRPVMKPAVGLRRRPALRAVPKSDA